jgi:hypothetical protein
MTIPPVPNKPPIRRLPRGCEVSIDTQGTICRRQARYRFPCGDATIDTCPRHGGYYAVMMTSGVSWIGMIERVEDE